MTWTLPCGDLGELGQGQVGQLLSKAGFPAFPRQLEPSNPWLNTLVVAMTGGYEPFRQKYIVPPMQDPGHGAIDVMAFTARQFGPQIFTTFPEQAYQSFTGAYNTNPNVPTPAQLIAQQAGLKQRGVDPRQALAFRASKFKRQIQEGRTRIAFGILKKVPVSARPQVVAYMNGEIDIKEVPKKWRGLAREARRVRRNMIEGEEELEQFMRDAPPLDRLPEQSPELLRILRGEEPE
jgi:hypothetical protein